MKILYATKNSAKFATMKIALKDLKNIELINLFDMKGDIPLVEENGRTPLENAKIKAAAYFEVYNMPVFSCDSGLYFDNVPESFQPGVFVRRPQGKELSDEEMIDYYSNLAIKFGILKAKYKNAICFIYNKNAIFSSDDDVLSGNNFIITSIPHKKGVKGFPLDCLSVNEKNEYYYDTNIKVDDINTKKGFEKFFKESLEKIKNIT